MLMVPRDGHGVISSRLHHDLLGRSATAETGHQLRELDRFLDDYCGAWCCTSMWYHEVLRVCDGVFFQVNDELGGGVLGPVRCRNCWMRGPVRCRMGGVSRWRNCWFALLG